MRYGREKERPGPLAAPREEIGVVKLTVLYGPPQDPAAFDEHYENIHVPLAAQIPNVQRFEAGRAVGMDGGAAPYHLIAELWFESAEQLQESMSSPEGQAAADDIPNFATGGATMFASEVNA